MSNKQLTRSESNKMVAGVCAGLADYFSIDVTLVRIIFALGSLFTAVITGIIVYFVLALVMPVR